MREINIKLNQSLEKAISILDCFSIDTQYQTIENICKLVNIPNQLPIVFFLQWRL